MFEFLTLLKQKTICVSDKDINIKIESLKQYYIQACSW